MNDIAHEPIQEGEVYINLMEERYGNADRKDRFHEPGSRKKVGVISYNETPLKKIILDGITTISTDFHAMGTMTAGLILQNEARHLEVPFYFTHRPSL